MATRFFFFFLTRSESLKPVAFLEMHWGRLCLAACAFKATVCLTLKIHTTKRNASPPLSTGVTLFLLFRAEGQFLSVFTASCLLLQLLALALRPRGFDWVGHLKGGTANPQPLGLTKSWHRALRVDFTFRGFAPKPLPWKKNRMKAKSLLWAVLMSAA